VGCPYERRAYGARGAGTDGETVRHVCRDLDAMELERLVGVTTVTSRDDDEGSGLPSQLVERRSPEVRLVGIVDHFFGRYAEHHQWIAVLTELVLDLIEHPVESDVHALRSGDGMNPEVIYPDVRLPDRARVDVAVEQGVRHDAAM